ncbi:MAG: hypothetical protein R2941_23955 [Desulfobacterales bacterium]
MGFLSPVWAEESDYYGSVAVNSPAGLGNIDLAFHIVMDDSTGVFDPQNSYVILDKTILFPKTAQVTVNGVLSDVGPLIENGYLTSLAFHLETQSFPGKVSSRSVIRRIVLEGIPQDEEGNTVIGTYTETISGFLPENILVSGDFILSRPVSVSKEKLTMDLQGVIRVLQICAGMNVAVDKEDDIDGNGKIDIAEAIYALQIVAGIRQ